LGRLPKGIFGTSGRLKKPSLLISAES
jgi:hypothetical protein